MEDSPLAGGQPGSGLHDEAWFSEQVFGPGRDRPWMFSVTTEAETREAAGEVKAKPQAQQKRRASAPAPIPVLVSSPVLPPGPAPDQAPAPFRFAAVSSAGSSWEHGLVAFKAGKFQHAIVLFTSVMSDVTAGDDGRLMLCARFNRAVCFLNLGRYDQARDDAAEVVRNAPHFAKGHLSLGHAQLGLGLNEAALASYAAALKLEPDNKEARERQLEIERKQVASRVPLSSLPSSN